MSAIPKELVAPRERSRHGCTITIVMTETGEVRSLARPHGTAVEALQAIVDELDAWLEPGTWLIRTISTPLTIWRDLQGRDDNTNPYTGGARRSARPESSYLRQIGRVDLLESR